jgi:hypothetical protein
MYSDCFQVRLEEVMHVLSEYSLCKHLISLHDCQAQAQAHDRISVFACPDNCLAFVFTVKGRTLVMFVMPGARLPRQLC